MCGMFRTLVLIMLISALSTNAVSGTNITPPLACEGTTYQTFDDCDSFIQGYIAALGVLDASADQKRIDEAEWALRTYSSYPERRIPKIVRALLKYSIANTASSGGLVAPYIGCVLQDPVTNKDGVYDFPKSRAARLKCNLKRSNFNKVDYWETAPSLNE